jgi:(p)ppGpp synthase/HD superfamily hydrolase
MTLIERAIAIALEAHAGQTDKAGAPYILHPLRLMHRMTAPTAQMAAVLHDVVEDSPWTLEALRAEGFPDGVIEAVDGLTRRDGETYMAFIERAAQHPVARVVKRADLEDNLDVRRLDAVAAKDQERLNRYLRALRELQDHDPR